MFVGVVNWLKKIASFFYKELCCDVLSFHRILLSVILVQCLRVGSRVPVQSLFHKLEFCWRGGNPSSFDDGVRQVQSWRMNGLERAGEKPNADSSQGEKNVFNVVLDMRANERTNDETNACIHACMHTYIHTPRYIVTLFCFLFVFSISVSVSVSFYWQHNRVVCFVCFVFCFLFSPRCSW